MATYEATVEWRLREGEDFTASQYSRGHRWRFDGGADVRASSSPHVVPDWSDLAGVDPQEALVASLASCPKLFFLALAAKKRLQVTGYVDRATGTMGKRDDGKEAMVAVRLSPEVTFAGDPPEASVLSAIHHKAHELCYIANSVNFPVTVAA